jgi:hypothetical protein
MPETMVEEKKEVSRIVTINEQEFEVSPLRCKHLRTISKILRDKSAQTATDFSSVERWMPFVLDSLQIKHKDFTQDKLDEMTLQEFNDTWEKIVAISGVQLAGKGETKPVVKVLSGSESTDESLPAVVGTTVQ